MLAAVPVALVAWITQRTSASELGTRSTSSTSPSRPTTRTVSPRSAPSSQRASQISPCDAHLALRPTRLDDGGLDADQRLRARPPAAGRASVRFQAPSSAEEERERDREADEVPRRGQKNRSRRTRGSGTRQVETSGQLTPRARRTSMVPMSSPPRMAAEPRRGTPDVEATGRSRSGRSSSWRALLLLVASLTVWVKRQALDTDNWTNASGQMLANDEIRGQLSIYLVDSLFTNVGRNARGSSKRFHRTAQPSRPVIAGALRNFAVQAADRLLATPQAQKLWEEANRRAHQNLLAVLNGEDVRRFQTADGISRARPEPRRPAAQGPARAERRAPTARRGQDHDPQLRIS